MIDIETLGRRNDAAIREVGLVAFRYDGSIIATRQLSLHPYAWSKNCRTFTGETIQWLVEEGFIAKDLNCPSYECLLDSIDKFFSNHIDEGSFVWSKGHMDLEVLKDLYETFDRPLPWEFWQPRDLRTILDFVPSAKKLAPNAQPHRAVGDAVYQVNQLCIVLPQLMSKKS